MSFLKYHCILVGLKYIYIFLLEQKRTSLKKQKEIQLRISKKTKISSIAAREIDKYLIDTHRSLSVQYNRQSLFELGLLIHGFL
jgi:hypothetical protein